MKEFAVKILIFLSPFIAGISWCEHGLNRVSNNLSKKRNEIEAKAADVKVLVLGNSLALRGINPNYFCVEGYNMANEGQSLFFDKEITLKYLQQLKSLKYAFITISYISLWHRMNDEDAIGYYQFWNIREPKLNPVNIRLYSKILFYNNQNAWQYALKNFNVDNAANLSKGWMGRNTCLPITDSSANEKLKTMGTVFNDWEEFTANCNYLHELVSALTKRNIKVIFISPPVTSVFMKYADKKSVEIADSVVRSISTSYNCKYVNYTKDSRFTNEDFSDVHHLNIQGSTKFSKILNTEILKGSDYQPFYIVKK